jgi:large subunit ribosomal protein L25
MAEAIEFKATTRARVGTGGARATRRSGLLPANIYGDMQEPQSIALDFNEIQLQFNKGRFLTTVLDIAVDEKTTRVIPREVQFDPVKDFPIHIDFLRVNEHSKVRVGVGVQFINHEESPGLKRGGILNIVRHEIEVLAPAAAIPDVIVVDLEGKDIGDSVHISAVNLPDGVVTTITDRDFTIVTIVGAAAMKPETEEEDAKAAAAGEAGEDGEEAKSEDGADDKQGS